ncbi:MAG TPA: helix-turn-helix domain-containing protein [Bryobacteraceae bacterium]|jgi:cytoskeletal protein RodZ
MTARGIQLPQDLMDLRKSKGLSLAQIAVATKIHLRYLEAIERGAFQELPGSLYTESYIRQYARAVDDADNALLDYYRSVFAPQTVRQITEPEPQSRMDRFRDVVRYAFGPDPRLPVRKRRTA